MRKITVCPETCDDRWGCGGMIRNCGLKYAENVAEIALCFGRHDIPQAVDGYIFEEVEDVTAVGKLAMIARRRLLALDVKHVDIYVTGLTPALIATLNAARALGISVVLYHYDRNTGNYFPQPVF